MHNTHRAGVTTNNRPDHKDLVNKLAAMTKPELLAYCTKIVAKAHQAGDGSQHPSTNPSQSDRRALAIYIEPGGWETPGQRPA